MNETKTSVQQQWLPENIHKEQILPEKAVQYCQARLANCPDNAELWFTLGTTFIELSRLPEAVQALQQAIALKPDCAPAYINLGYVLDEQGLPENAVQCYQNGLAACPDNADLWFNLGTILKEMSRPSEAVPALQQAVAFKPDYAAAYINLANALKEQGLYEEAVQCYHNGLAVCPDNADLWFNLATDLSELFNLPAAVTAFQQAIALKPDFISAYINLGNAFIELQKPSEAVKAYQQAIALQPDFADAYCNLGNALQLQGKAADAVQAYDRAIALNPANPEVYYNRATAILLNGDLARGFAEYERRRHIKRFHPFYEWCDDIPRWGGEIFAGKRLLIFHEQGFGDALQFSRYLPLVKLRGGIVQFSVKQPLLRLFSNFPGVDELIEHTAATIAGAQADLAVPLMSLPYIFDTTLATIPANIPLPVAQHCMDLWRKRINNQAANLRIGLVWAGSPAHIPGQTRTCGLQALVPLADIPGVTFYSLQKGDAATEAHRPPPGLQLIDLTDDITDFADTAALIMNLDLVISVDTAVAHLAGALGKPVWTLLPSAGEWRWLLDRNDTPWYPAMRLFRQSAPGDWSSVMTAVVQKLRHCCQQKFKDPSALAGF